MSQSRAWRIPALPVERNVVASFKAAVVVIAAAAALGAVSIPASADATDFPTGVLVDANDIANATVAASLENAGSPDVTCANPTAEGTVVTPATDAHPVGTVDGND